MKVIINRFITSEIWSCILDRTIGAYYVVSKLQENNDINIEKIAKAGQKWALENYCPKGVANYILSKLL